MITEWDIADMVLDKVYPKWPNIPNRGILRGAIANALVDAIKSTTDDVNQQHKLIDQQFMIKKYKGK